MAIGNHRLLAYRKVFAMQKQWSVEVVRRIKEWANGCWDDDEITWKNLRTTGYMNQWTNELINQWINESRIQWISESMDQWTNESMNQWSNEPMKQRMDGWINGWMGGRAAFLCWVTSSLSDLFAEAPLLSATSSLSNCLSGLLVPWAASQLALL